MADKYITGLYQELEQEVIADIARRIRKTGRYTETAEIMVKSMTEQGYSAEKIRTEVMRLMRADKDYQAFVAQNTKEYKAYVQSEINATLEKAKEAGSDLAEEAGNMAFNNDLSMWEQAGVDLKKPNTMSQLMDSFRKQTINELKNLTRTTGFKNTAFGNTSVENIYQKELDLALLKVASGSFSYDQAVNDCIHRLAQSGLRSIDYANGRSYQLDTAIRMSVRTGVSQLSGRITEANLQNTGVDLVITSQHIGARDEHVPWQNKVFSYSGKSKKYPDFVSSTGYGTPGGLKGVNCTHNFYPFWEGISIVPEDIKEPAPVTVNGKEYTYYQATQKQRQMERNIRATKREIEAQNAIGGDTKELKKLLKQQTNDYMMFSNDVGIRPKENRLRVVSGSSSKKKNFSDLSEKGGLNADMFRRRSNTNNSKNDKVVLEYNKNIKTIQSTLKKAEKSKQKLNYEVGTVVDLRGNIVATFDGSGNNVEIPIELLKDAIFTHNHPAGGCFSAADIGSMIASGLYELRASTPDGSFYSLKRGENTILNEEIVKSYKAATSKKKASEAIRYDIQRGVLSREEVTERIEEFSIEYRSRLGEDWLDNNAHRCGLIYRKGAHDE